MGIILIIKLSEGLIRAIPQLVSKIPEIIGSIVNGFGRSFGVMSDIGLNLVKGIWNGISDATGWILGKIKGFGQSIVDGIKSFFGIHSPSVLFKEEIGKNLALGVGEGFTDNMDGIVKDMQNSLPTNFDLGVNTSINNSVLSSALGSLNGKSSSGGIFNISFGAVTINNDNDIETIADKLQSFIIKKQLAVGGI